MILEVTSALPQIAYPLETDVAKIVSGGASLRGMSAMQTWLSCPERARLIAAGIRRKRNNGTVQMTEVIDHLGNASWMPDPLGVQYGAKDYFFELNNALEFGSVAHHLRACRIVHGHEACEWVISQLNVTEIARLTLLHTFRIYNDLYPLDQEPFKYVGVECEVRTDIGPPGQQMIRTVRYDSVIAYENPRGVFSFECKTSRNSGGATLEGYMPQAMGQVALWNNNASLVAQHGPMLGVIYDQIVKSEVPKCERHNPKYISKLMQQRAVEYMRLPEQITFPVIQAQGGPCFPRFMHSCWGRYGACEYTSLCYEDARGQYDFPETA